MRRSLPNFLWRFVILDMGNGLPVFVQKLLPMCTERIIVVEGCSRHHSTDPDYLLMNRQFESRSQEHQRGIE